MGDRCHMQVTCRRQDIAPFEALGFTLQFDQTPGCPVVELIDEEANYAHGGQLPTTVPFLASHGAGGNFGHGEIACDGNRYAEAEVGHGCGYVVRWNDATSQPTPESLAGIREYLAVQHTVQAMFKSLAAPAPQHPGP